jgi:hypothetical protein
MVTLCLKHKNDPSKGQIGRGQHPQWRKTIMRIWEYCERFSVFRVVLSNVLQARIFKTKFDNDCQALSQTMTAVWESMSLRVGYAKAVLLGVPDPLWNRRLMHCPLQNIRDTIPFSTGMEKLMGCQMDVNERCPVCAIGKSTLQDTPGPITRASRPLGKVNFEVIVSSITSIEGFDYAALFVDDSIGNRCNHLLMIAPVTDGCYRRLATRLLT